MRLVKAFFIVLLFIFPVGQIGRVELGGGVNILLNDIVVFLTVVSWLVYRLLIKKPIVATEFDKPILFFALTALFALVMNQEWLTAQEMFISSLYLIRWISYAGLYFVVRDFDNVFKQKILYILVATGTVIALFGILQYFLYPDLRNLFYLGWDEHLYRLFSTFFDPNFTGGIFVLTFILALSFVFNKEEFGFARPRPFGLSPQGRRLARLTLSFAALASFIGLLLTYSRGSFISFALGSLTLLLLSGRKKVAVLFLLIFTFGILLLPKSLEGEGVKLFRTASIVARSESAKEALSLFKENSLFGVGFNAYRYARQRHARETSNVFGSTHSASGTDNSFLFVLATTGIVGFALYIYLWFRVGRVFWKNPLILATIVALFVHAFFVNSLFYPHIMEWVWILVGSARAQKLL